MNEDPGYEIIYTPKAAHVHNRPDVRGVAWHTIVKCSCGEMFRAEDTYDWFYAHHSSNREWVAYEGCPYSMNRLHHTKQWCGYEECRES